MRLGKARMMVMIVRCAGMPAGAVMLASAMRGAENVRRFEHVFVITGVNTRSSTSIAGTLPSGLPALLLERAPDPVRLGTRSACRAVSWVRRCVG